MYSSPYSVLYMLNAELEHMAVMYPPSSKGSDSSTATSKTHLVSFSGIKAVFVRMTVMCGKVYGNKKVRKSLGRIGR